MHLRTASKLLAVLLAALAGCGGGGSSSTPAAPPAVVPATLDVNASAPTALVGGTVTITASVLQVDGTPVTAGTIVTFAASGGTLAGTGRTDAAGNASATLTSGAGGPVTVFVSVGTLPARTRIITFIDPNAPHAVSVTATPLAPAIGSEVVLTATVTAAGANGTGGAGGTVPNGTTVTFTTTAGTIAAVTTTTNGQATAVLRGITTPTVSFVTASVNGVASPPTLISWEDPAHPPAAAPATLAVSTSAPSAVVGASVTITANVLQANGTPVNANTAVTFAASGGALAGTGRTDASGNAVATLTSGVGGPVTVFVGVGTLPAQTRTITFIDPNAPHAVSVVAAPVSAVVGTEVVLTATVTAAGTDGAGGAGGTVPNGTTVDFTTTAGTIAAVTTTTNGQATAVLRGITAPTVVFVTAFVNGVVSLPTMVTWEDPALPGGVAVATTPEAGFVGAGGVTVTAHVTSLSGSSAPAGVAVAFAIRSGNGTLSAPSAFTDASGNATVTLTSPAEGVVNVSATSAGPFSGSVTVAFSNPSKPGAVALVADPPTGVTAGQRPVTLTATVSPVDAVHGAVPDGTPVTFTVVGGTGTLSATTAVTVGGVASVRLDAAQAGAVSVAARAGTSPAVSSSPVAVPFLVQPTLVVLKLGTTGTLLPGASVGGVSAVVRASPAAGLSLQAADVAASGAGAGALLVANTTDVAANVVAVISAAGIAAGEFATLTFHVAPGTFPSAQDFSVALTGAGVIDATGTTLPLGVGIVGLTVQ